MDITFGAEWAGVVAAPLIGSFAGTAAQRLAHGQGFVTGRSRCDVCGQTLSAAELVPLISWAVLRGRCARCHAGIGVWPVAAESAYLAVALVTIAVSAGVDFWIGCLLGWALLALALIDLKTFLLPDLLTFSLAAAGLGYSATLGLDVLRDHAVGAALGFGSLYAVGTAYRAIRGRDGLGRGDAKLFAGAGAWLGIAALPDVLLIAATAALTVEVVRWAFGGKLDRLMPIAFGPYLALAIWIGWIDGTFWS